MGLLALYQVSANSSIDDQWARSGVRNYLAWFTTDADENAVRNGLGVVINDPHPSDSGQVVTRIDVSCTNDLTAPTIFVDPLNPSNSHNGTNCYLWEVEIQFGPWDPLTHTATGDPADQPVDFSFDWQFFEKAVDWCYNPTSGLLEPVVNSAGDPFDPPVTREEMKGVLRVAWNSHTFNPVALFTYGNFINSDLWNGFPAGSVKFSPPKMPQRLYSQFLGSNYYRLEAEFGFNPNDAGWNAYPIDRGYRALNSSGVPTKIFDVNGQPVSSPVLLNGSGGVLPPDGTSFYQFNLQIYKSVAFATLFPSLTNLFS